MFIPLSWLEEFVELEGVSASDIAERLSLQSVEAYVHTFGTNLEKAVTGVVLESREHPKNKQWLILKVDTGDRKVSIVTADRSVSVGDEVFVALSGGRVGEKVIEDKDFEGVTSQGVLLSAQELGLEDSSGGVLKFREGIEAGSDVSRLLGFGEELIELDITPNRGDVLSIRGLAREVSALFKLKKKERSIEPLEEKGSIEINIKDKDCSRYRAVLIEGVRVENSPLRIRKRLWQCGVKSINNVVDITNYILLQEGQPLHAFDFNKLKGGIKVRSAVKGETITTLDGEERELKEEILVIADSERPHAVAGVIGGLESGVTKDTKAILLESAYFNPYRVRRSSKLLGVKTESSYRFERGVDIEWVEEAQNLAVSMILKLGGGEVLAVKDVYPERYEPKKIFLSMGKFMRYAGESYKNEEASEILTALEIEHEVKRCGLEVFVPPHRSFDLHRDVDLIEEIMRVKGYEHLEAETLKLPSKGKLYRDPEGRLRNFLIGKGISEVISIPFEEGELYELLGLEEPSVEVLNPLVPSQRFMRSSILPSLIRNCQFNENHYNHDMAIFELGNVFLPHGEEPRLGILVKGMVRAYPPKEWDAFTLTEVVAGIGKLFRKELTMESSQHQFLHPHIQAEVNVEGERIGFIGKLHPSITDKLGLKSEPFVAELRLEPLTTEKNPVYKRFSKFPPVIRDLALVMDKSLSVSKLLNEIKSHLSEKVEEVMVFDLYAGEKVGEGKKSVGVRVAFRSLEGSLSNEEVNELVETLVRRLKETLRVDIR